ncbi:hypothetical protein, partial [Glaesserella parasuis]
DSLKLISDKTKITFQESSEEFLADGTGINFVFSEMKESLLGFASHGGNVHLNALKFSDKLTPENQGISTLLHETMHALALKHPFVRG